VLAQPAGLARTARAAREAQPAGAVAGSADPGVTDAQRASRAVRQRQRIGALHDGTPVHGRVSGQIGGPSLGVLAACSDRSAYPSTFFALTERRTSFEGTAAELTVHEEQLRLMLDTLYNRLAEVTGREPDAVRADARRGRMLSTEDALSYGLIQHLAGSR
jgi:Clp protease